jgi:hypothetical protein
MTQLYDTDFYIWTQEMAQRLRDRDVAVLDWENIADRAPTHKDHTWTLPRDETLIAFHPCEAGTLSRIKELDAAGMGAPDVATTLNLEGRRQKRWRVVADHGEQNSESHALNYSGRLRSTTSARVGRSSIFRRYPPVQLTSIIIGANLGASGFRIGVFRPRQVNKAASRIVKP